MSVEQTIPLRAAVEAYLLATGSSPSLAHQVLAEVGNAGRLELLGDALPYFEKDGRAVVERKRFEALLARVRADRT
jgi:hypothetical protein